MDHQNWETISLNPKKTQNEKKLNSNYNSSKKDDEEIKIVPAPQLGQLISNARNIISKSRKQLANELAISEQVLARWETNKEIPSNLDISKIEKILKIKLPRSKKVKSKDNN